MQNFSLLIDRNSGWNSGLNSGRSSGWNFDWSFGRSYAVLSGLFTLLVFLGGCTHTRLLNQGDSFVDQGRYELAMQQYDQALQIKPDKDETQQKYQQAKTEFGGWLSTIQNAADIAYDRNQKGRALLLYGKVLSSMPNSAQKVELESRYKALYSELSDQSMLHVRTHYSADVFGDNLESDVADILPLQKEPDGLNNTREFTFEFQEFDGKTTEWIEEVSGEYISAEKIVRNPEIDYLQHHFHDLNHEMRELRHEKAGNKHELELAKKLVTKARKEDQGDERSEHSTESTESTDSTHSTQSTNTRQPKQQDTKELRQAKAQLERARRELNATIESLENHEERLHQVIHELDVTPITIIEPVYSTHSFSLTHSLYELGGDVVVTEANQSDVYEIEVVSEDAYHDAQPLLNLPADPLVQSNYQQLSKALHNEARNFAQDYLRGAVENYRAGLLSAANRTNDLDSRIEKFVSYGLSTRNGVNAQIGSRMAQQLQTEYGIEGEFPINGLLHRF